ncbi:ElyC/SanA/YdcF family protein [Actinobaculum sp. 352]|uniref:SanA/YdcF family protein n=1 Tax=Actinobaculum sp. 352 TaxID=2490946 RepID=UPI0019D2D85C|nr:ElyC/SanA/YdcF family protein [Actinobaculum sp. 352]
MTKQQEELGSLRDAGKSADSSRDHTPDHTRNRGSGGVVQRRWMKRLGTAFAALIVLAIGGGVGINQWVTGTTHDRVYAGAAALPSDADPDCIIVLGASVRSNGQPSAMLEERLKTALELYNEGAAPKILVSGDNSTEVYNEVKVMREWLVAHGVPSEDVFEDHAGFSTYETMYRARDVFAVDHAIVVTQQYHLGRALYDAQSLGLTVWGVPSGGNDYPGQNRRDAREWLARVHDWGQCLTNAKPTYLGDVIPISGNGEATR